MTTSVASLIGKARVLLQDTNGIRNPDMELLGWLNDGQREAVIQNPKVYQKDAAVTLVAGVTQTLPADGHLLGKVTRNANGVAITQVSRTLMDAWLPTWTVSTANATVKHCMYEPELNEREFFVFPPQPATGTGTVQMQYYAIPADTTLEGDITLADKYANALLDYVMYRAYAKEIEQGDGTTAAAAHYQAFLTAVKGAAPSA